MWDLANGKLLRTITDAHPPGTAILHVKVETKLGKVCEIYGYIHYFSVCVRVCVCSLQMIRLSQFAMTVEDLCLSWRSGKHVKPISLILTLVGVDRSLYSSLLSINLKEEEEVEQ